MAQQTHFERLIAAKRQETLESMASIANGDSHQHAVMKGVLAGLKIATECYHDAFKRDIDPDDDR